MYASENQREMYGATAKPPVPQSRRLNIVAISVALFLPWLAFCLTFCGLSFEPHYNMGSSAEALAILLAFVLFAAFLFVIFKRQTGWSTFVLFSCFLAVATGYVLGNRNYNTWMKEYYDLDGLNTYEDVDPATMKGQEMMDAGRVTFLTGTPIDLKRSMGFKNMDTYCVAPITSGAIEGGAPLEAYDFWAVGTNCCTSGSNDFKCHDYDKSSARGAIRVVKDEDRAFYRLAVQQAESVYAIKAVHPLFFYWKSDVDEELSSYRRYGYKGYFVAMCSYFGVQLVLVSIATMIAKRGIPFTA